MQLKFILFQIIHAIPMCHLNVECHLKYEVSLFHGIKIQKMYQAFSGPLNKDRNLLLIMNVQP